VYGNSVGDIIISCVDAWGVSARKNTGRISKMNRWLQQIIVGLAGTIGGILGFFVGFIPVLCILWPLFFVGAAIAIAVGLFTAALGAARSGEIVGKFLERYD
jgi:hypothetical protein